MNLHGEGKELIGQLTPGHVWELINNTEVTSLILHTKPWKYYVLCNLPYSALKIHKSGRYEWLPIDKKTARYFQDRVVRLKHAYVANFLEEAINERAGT